MPTIRQGLLGMQRRFKRRRLEPIPLLDDPGEAQSAASSCMPQRTRLTARYRVNKVWTDPCWNRPVLKISEFDECMAGSGEAN